MGRRMDLRIWSTIRREFQNFLFFDSTSFDMKPVLKGYLEFFLTLAG